MNIAALVSRGAAALALAAALTAGPALAETGPIKLSGSPQNFFRIRHQVAVPAYHVTFITQQQATAVASIGARTRLNTVLVGVDEATMRRLTNEAHADLIAQFVAAGITPIPQDQARALAAEVEAFPGNQDVAAVGAGITIGKSVRRGYATYGADAAPALKPYQNASSPNGVLSFTALGAHGKIGKAAKAVDAVAVIPSLTFDYINMEASTGAGFLGQRASAEGELAFSLRAGSLVTLVGAADAGPGYAGGWRLDRDVASATPFARVATGGAGVRTGSMTDTTDSNYQAVQRARGDAVVVDLPVWEGLVRDHYRAYNAAIVAAIVKARAG